VFPRQARIINRHGASEVSQMLCIAQTSLFLSYYKSLLIWVTKLGVIMLIDGIGGGEGVESDNYYL